MPLRTLAALAAFVPALGSTPVAHHPQPGGRLSYPPGAIPVHGALVHLKGDTCTQRASVSLRTTQSGGKGLVLVSDPPALHWLSSPWPRPGLLTARFSGGAPQLLDNAPILGGYWLKLTFLVPGHFTLGFASDQCGYGNDLYVATATVVSVTAT